MNIFTGVKVLDLTKVFAGPLATRILADYGAEVIKIEAPDRPDDARFFPPIVNGTSGYFATLNRHKKFITLDLKTECGKEEFRKMCVDADIVVENLTPKTKQKLGIDYESVKQINPLIIYASLSGRGQDNERKYYDVIGQAESGLLSMNGEKNSPIKIGPAVVDAYAGINLAFAIAAALFERARRSKGQWVRVDMLGCAFNLVENGLATSSMTGKDPERMGNIDGVTAPFGVYKVKDGWLAIAIGNDSQWNDFEKYITAKTNIDCSGLETNKKRLEDQERLTKIIEEALQDRSAEEAEKILTELNVPCGQVKTMTEVVNTKEYFSKKWLVKEKIGELDCVLPGYPISFGE